jgi:hypothetical protein
MVFPMTTSQAELSNKRWFTSKEAKALLKVSDCHLMHLRVQGALIYKKEGNRFFYLLESEFHGEKGNSIDL